MLMLDVCLWWSEKEGWKEPERLVVVPPGLVGESGWRLWLRYDCDRARVEEEEPALRKGLVLWRARARLSR